ncbi:hypothetical protein ACFJGW_20845 [Burkholderiaceae bacterium UC74_6]
MRPSRNLLNSLRVAWTPLAYLAAHALAIAWRPSQTHAAVLSQVFLGAAPLLAVLAAVPRNRLAVVGRLEPDCTGVRVVDAGHGNPACLVRALGCGCR